jgi:hypothetical protein
VHHWLVGFVLEVGFPALFEVGGWPGLELLELGGSRTNLNARFDAVGGKGAGSLEVPLLKDTWGGLAKLFLPLFEDKLVRFCTSGTPRAKSSNVSVPGLAL